MNEKSIAEIEKSVGSKAEEQCLSAFETCSQAGTDPFVVGKYLAKSGCIGLDRENNRGAVKAINRAADNIKNGVCAMGIYPEGYVNKKPGTLLPFRNGAFKIAKKAKVPIVVSVVKNTREANKNMFRRHSDVYLKILEVIPYEKFSDLKTNEIGETVYKMMVNEI